MSALTVLVTFYSRGGATETLAHAAAVGAVQKRALIRLRRVADPNPQDALARGEDSRDSLRRMHREYVAPREADVLAADALILASPADVDAAAAEWSSYLDLLAQLNAAGKLTGKVAAVIHNGAAAASFSAALGRLSVVLVPSDEATDSAAAIALGRRVVAAAETARATSTSP